jgi:hypothetical protein
MLTLIVAAAAAAAQPGNAHSQMVAQASQASEHSQMPMMQMGMAGEHKAMDCCKDGCKDMAGKHDGDTADHAQHNDR